MKQSIIFVAVDSKELYISRGYSARIYQLDKLSRYTKRRLTRVLANYAPEVHYNYANSPAIEYHIYYEKRTK